MNQLNLSLAAFGVALSVHKLGDSVAFSWFLVAFSIVIAAIIFLKLESNKNAIAMQINLMLTLVLSLFGGVMAWL